MTTSHSFRAGSAAGYLHPIADGRLRSPQEITTTLTNALGAADYSGCIKDLRRVGIDPQSYIDGLDEVCPCFGSSFVPLHSWALGYQAIDILSHESDIYERCVRALSKVCGIYGLLPDSHKVRSGLTVGEHAVASGGFSDVWKADDGIGGVFAVKVLRMYQNNAERVKKVGQHPRSPTNYQRISDQPSEIPEILHRSDYIQAGKPPKCLADRGSGPGFVPVLHGVEVDAERDPVEVFES